MSAARWIGEYEIVRRLRVGGMATLYLARRHGAAGFSRLAAIKVVHPHLLEQPAFIEMFIDEARICSQISHPNVVHVEEFGEIDGQHYLVMEHISGCSVHELIHAQRQGVCEVSPELAAYVIMNAARGLHAAHEALGPDGQPLEIIHRDITPSNILLSTAGHVKVIDFGIARARNRLSATEAGFALKGKYGYMAPEQALPMPIDRRTDVFALGVVFWELLTGKQLFADEHVALFNRLYTTQVEAPSVVNRNVPQDLDELVLDMLEHNAENRPATALDVQRRIAQVIPAAAALEGHELGALVIAAQAFRQATPNAEERTAGDQSFSPMPRSNRGTTPPVSSRIDVVPLQLRPLPPEPATQPQTVAPTAPPPRRRLWLAIAAGAVALGGGLAVVIGNTGPTAKPVADSPPTIAAVVPPPPATPSVPPPSPVVVEPPQADPEPAPTPAPPPAPPPERTTEPKRAPVRVARAAVPKATSKAAAKRAPTTAAQVRAPEPEVEATRAPAKTKTIRAGKSVIVEGAFDDAANASSSAAAPSQTKIKKTTIVTDFGN